MNQFFDAIRSLIGQFKIWVTIVPWEQGLRVRFGKRVKLLTPGVHFILPLTDRLYIQSVRLRLVDLGRQTSCTADEKPITIGGIVQYAIADLQRLYNTIHQAEDTIRNIVQAEISKYITSHIRANCTAENISRVVTLAVREKLAAFGLTSIEVRLTEMIHVKTYRIVTGDAPAYISNELNTNYTTDPRPSH